jgi:hypothetical protein
MNRVIEARYLRFRLLDLFWLLLLAACSLSWLAERRHLQHRVDQLETQVSIDPCAFALTEIVTYLQDEGYDVNWTDKWLTIKSSHRGNAVSIRGARATAAEQLDK